MAVIRRWLPYTVTAIAVYAGSTVLYVALQTCKMFWFQHIPLHVAIHTCDRIASKAYKI